MICPECRSDIPDDAVVCRHCTRRIKGKACPECLTVCNEKAVKCAACSHDFGRDKTKLDFETFTTKASLLATLIIRFRLLPQKIELTSDKIAVTTYGYFYLTTTVEEIPWEKIAGYHFHSGMFWDSVQIQTRGQTANYMDCLKKADSPKIKEILEKMKQ